MPFEENTVRLELRLDTGHEIIAVSVCECSEKSLETEDIRYEYAKQLVKAVLFEHKIHKMVDNNEEIPSNKPFYHLAAESYIALKQEVEKEKQESTNKCLV